MISKSDIAAAEDLYKKTYAGRGLAPRSASGLKDALAKAIHNDESPKRAASAFLKEKGIELKEPSEKMPDDSKKEGKKKRAREPESKKKSGKKSGKKDEKKDDFEPVKEVDRATLKAAAVELFQITGKKIATGADVTDEDLRRAVHAGVASLAQPANIAVLDALKGDYKIVDALGDCIGIYVDMKSAECVKCPDQAMCVRTFATNLRDGFKTRLKGIDAELLSGISRSAKSIQDRVAEVEEHAVKQAKTESKKNGVSKKKGKPAFDPNKILVICEAKNPHKPGTQEHAFVSQVLEEGSMPVQKVEEIYNKVFNDGPLFFSNAVKNLITMGLATWPEDLPKSVVKSLSKAEKRSIGLS